MMASDDAFTASRLMSDATQSDDGVSEGRLMAFLSAQPDIGGEVLDVVVDRSRRSAGASSGTALFEIVLAPVAAPTRRSLVFRYDLGGAFFSQYELAPQFLTMQALFRRGFPVPRPLWLDAAGAVIGHPGMVMERVDGAAPSTTPFVDGPFMEVASAARHERLLNAARTLARLHRIDPATADFAHLEGRGTGDHFLEREIHWNLVELRRAIPPSDPRGKQDFYTEVRDTLEHVGQWLLDHVPRHRARELAHGDANITNFMFAGPAVAALLDYELTHLGLGEADLGYQLAGIDHFRLLAPPVDGVPTHAEMIDAYREARGKLEDWDYARAMGAWRLAVFAAMGLSRLPPELDHIERTYWQAGKERLAAMAPGLPPSVAL